MVWWVKLSWDDVKLLYEWENRQKPHYTPIRSALVKRTTFSRMGCGLATRTLSAIIMYCDWKTQNREPLTDSMRVPCWYAKLYYGLHRVVMHCSFGAGCPELDLVAAVGRTVEQWREDLDAHIASDCSDRSKADVARLFISQQLFQDTCTFCNGLVFLCAWWGKRFPGFQLRGAMLTLNVVENEFSQQHQAMGGGRNPDAKSVCSTMCMLRYRAGLAQLTALVGKLSYADMDGVDPPTACSPEAASAPISQTSLVPGSPQPGRTICAGIWPAGTR